MCRFENIKVHRCVIPAVIESLKISLVLPMCNVIIEFCTPSTDHVLFYDRASAF